VIDVLNETLELAVRGQATRGWSNEAVVESVGELCGVEDLITWTVQP
jgi:hypothetical protein